jgi:hypothetical protein
VGYEEATHTLEVEFLDGRLYQYFSVPKSEFTQLMSASSHGSYYVEHIKEAGYAFNQIG